VPTVLTSARSGASIALLQDCEALGTDCVVMHGGASATAVLGDTAVLTMDSTATKWEAPSVA